MTKLFKRKNFIQLILSILLALPFLNILFTTLYVIFNKNAFESFEAGITLSSAFEYSLSEFITSNNFGKIDFFTWFANIFLDNTAHDLLYIHFINWYLNYALYVSISLIIFHVLYWFIDFLHKLLNKTSDVAQ